MSSSQLRLARLFLRLYPKRFRDRYGAEILAFLGQELEQRGPLARLGRYLVSLLNLISNALLLRWESLPESRPFLILMTPLAGDLELPMPRMLMSDLKYALRSLFKRPMGTILIVVTIALGVGINTAMFSVVHGVLLQPLPFSQAERLVQVSQTDVANQVFYGGVSYPDYLDYVERQSAFESLAAYQSRIRTRTGGEFPELIQVSDVTPSLFNTLGVYPERGRLLAAADAEPNSANVGVISYRYWQNQLGGDASSVGSLLTIDGETLEIVGVLPDGRAFPAGSQVIRPMRRELDPDLRGVHDIGVIARLASGTSLQQADAQIRAIMQDLEQEYPEHNEGRGGVVRPLLQNTVRQVDDMLWLLMGAVTLILIITCANIANLLAARAESRRREIAIRCAIGASPWRLVKQFLTESVVLALMGGAVGIGVAAVALAVLKSIAPADLPRMDEVSLNGVVLVFGFGVTLLTGILFGLLPSRVAVRQQHAEDIKDGARGSEGAAAGGTRRVLVIVQIALAFVLVSGTTLLTRSLIKAESMDPGYNAEGLVSAGISLPQSKYPWSWRDYPHGPAVMPFYEELYQALARQAPLSQFALAMQGPADPAWTSQIDVPNQGPHAPIAQQEEYIRLIGPGYLPTTGVPLLVGRNFTAQDRGDAPAVVIVNESFVRKFFGDAPAVGETLSFWSREREIIGVVKDVRFQGLDREPAPAVYGPLLQNPGNGISIVARSQGNTESALRALRTALVEVDPDIALRQVSTVNDLLHGQLSARRFNLSLFGVFAGLAAALAFIGVYGVMTYAVNSRRFEFGVRLSFGATARDLLTETLSRAAKLFVIGLTFGIPVSLLAAGFLSSELVAVGVYDPVSYLIVAVLMILGVLLASLIPARKAAASDPLTALRAE